MDWAVYRHAEGGVMVNLDTMMGEGGDAMGDVLAGIELVWGSDDMENGDTFIASAGADIIHGDNGPDTLSYEASSMGVIVDLSDQTAWDATDSPTNAISGAPADATSPGAGMPTDDFGDAIGMFSAVSVSDTGVVTTTDTTAEADDNINGAAGDLIGGIQNVTGSAHDDVLTGDAQDNTLRGNDGDDVIIGGDGNDSLLYGGKGEDRIWGGEGNDTLDGCTGDDTLMGGVGNDMLIGRAGHDTMMGEAGDDTLSGMAGDDDMDGGIGDDTFIIGLDNGDDYITNFDANNDAEKIDLQAFDGITSFDDLTMRVRGGNTVIDLSAHGGDSITLVGVTTDLDANDFIFVL